MKTRRRGALGRHERRFLRRLGTSSYVLPRHERTSLLRTAHTNLEDRPPADSWDSLTHELGDPEAYVREFVHDEAGRPKPAAWRRMVAWFPSRRAAVVAAIALVTLVGGALAYRQWSSERPVLSETCFAVEAADGIPLESSEAMGYREQVVTYVDGATLVLPVCVSSAETIEVLDIQIPGLEEYGPVELIEVTMQPQWTYPHEPTTGEVAFAPHLLGSSHTDLEHRPQVVWHRFRFSGCAAALRRDADGVYFSVQAPEVTYRHRGRTHVQQLDQTASISIRIDRAECPGLSPLPQPGAADGEDGQ